MPESLRVTLDFLRDLRANNHKLWFDQNRKRYEASKRAYEDFITELIIAFGQYEDLGNVSADQSIYRIFRDVRFSPDKTPYKTNVGAVIGKGGRKSDERSYYLQIGPNGESFIAAGLYMPDKEQLDKMRRSIIDDSAAFRKILNKRDFKHLFGGLEGDQLKTAPQGYTKDHPDIDLLRYKQFLVSHPLPEEMVLSDDLIDHTVAAFNALKPFVTYIAEALESEG